MKVRTKAERELDELEIVFKALAHNARRHILIILHSRGGTMSAGEIVERFSCSWPTTTRHLRQLENAGLVIVQKQGREQIYKINIAKLNKVIGNWLNWFNKE